MKKTILLLISCLTLILFSGICVGVDTSNVSQLDTGVLTGRVTDIMGFPVDDALITVVYHVDVVHTGFSDENGFYKIDDICLCKCLKNVTCSKTGYNIVNVLIPINNLTVHDFVLI